MGRQSTYSEKVANEICNRIANGEFLRVICREEGMPAWQTVYDWINTHGEFARRFARAREIGADAIAEDIVGIIDADPERVSGKYGVCIDSGFVQWQKNRAEQRLKLLAKWHPQRYGDRVSQEISGPGGKPIEVAKLSDTELMRIAAAASQDDKPV